MRLKGDYLALATFGFGVIVYSVSKNWIDLTRGPMGLPGIPKFAAFGFELQPVWAYLILVIVFVAISAFVMNRIVDSPFGRILKSVREDEVTSLSGIYCCSFDGGLRWNGKYRRIIYWCVSIGNIPGDAQILRYAEFYICTTQTDDIRIVVDYFNA